LNSTPALFGLSFFLLCCFRDFGCGKAMSFDGLLIGLTGHSGRPAKAAGLTATRGVGLDFET
jgi:hypothetical protein